MASHMTVNSARNVKKNGTGPASAAIGASASSRPDAARVGVARAPPDEAELARRRQAKLSPRQEANLARWGYPYVFEEWRFHVTLTRRLSPEEREVVLPAAEAHLRDALRHRRRVSAVCVFTQARPGAPFLIAERLPFGG